WRIEKILRIENVVADELEQAAVQLIRPRLGDHVDYRARLAPELRRVRRFLDVELADGFYGRREHHVVKVFVGHGRAVYQVQVVAAALPQDVYQRPGLLHGVAASSAG